MEKSKNIIWFLCCPSFTLKMKLAGTNASFHTTQYISIITFGSELYIFLKTIMFLINFENFIARSLQTSKAFCCSYSCIVIGILNHLGKQVQWLYIFSLSVTGVKCHGKHALKFIEMSSPDCIVQYKSYCRLLGYHHSRFPYTIVVFLTSLSFSFP